MTENKKIALTIAMGVYFEEIVPAEDYEKMSFGQIMDNTKIFEPFKYWVIENICKEVDILAYNIEYFLNEKDKKTLAINTSFPIL